MATLAAASIAPTRRTPLWHACIAIYKPLVAAFAAALVAICPGVNAQTWPSKAVRIINPYPTGGNADIVVRKLSETLTKKHGRPVIVDYAIGASGNVGGQAVARTDGDGYTLLFFAHPLLTVNPWIMQSGGFSAERDLVPVVRVAETVNVLMFSKKFSASNLRELAALGKAKPKSINFGNGGVGSTAHLAAEELAWRIGIEVLHVPYKGSAPAGLALAAGEIDMQFEAATSGVPRHKNGFARLIATGGTKRLSSMPDVPTIAESGVAGFESVLVNGIAVPSSTPLAMQREINERINEALADPALRGALIDLGSEVNPGSLDEFKQFIVKDREKWGKLIKERNLVLQ